MEYNEDVEDDLLKPQTICPGPNTYTYIRGLCVVYVCVWCYHAYVCGVIMRMCVVLKGSVWNNT